ncbi:MAG: hypothetical protein ACREQI_09680 [Candidatus Binataceae bacterium]
MKLRHTAALALIAGWVLLEPPVFIPPPSDNPPPLDANLAVPPSKWTNSGEFKTLEDCKQQQKKILDGIGQGHFPFTVPDNMSKQNLAASQANISFAAGAALCVSADNPMFKKKN